MADGSGAGWGGRRGIRGGARETRELVARVHTLERVRVELERERVELRRILAGIGEGVLAVDRAGIVVHANPAAIDLLGMARTGGIGSHMLVAIPHERMCSVLDDAMRGVVAAGSQHEMVVRDGGGGAERVLIVTTSRLRDVDDAPTERTATEGAIAVVRDVTEIRRLERARRDFFANASHELKTPITAIRGAIETIVEDDAMPAETRRRFLDGAVRHVRRLGRLVNDLMALARLEAGEEALSFERVDLAVIVADVVAAAEQLAASRRVSIEAAVDSADANGAAAAAAIGDEEALRQAVSNLVDNAVAHSEVDGCVRVVVRPGLDVHEVLVVDRGPGIAPDDQARIFERFFRVDAARSRARGGTGIGLSIVKHVAQAHGGAVSVDSVVGEGSTFRLSIPVSRSPGAGTSGA